MKKKCAPKPLKIIGSFRNNLQISQYFLGMKRKATGEHESAPQPKKRLIDLSIYRARLEQIVTKYKQGSLRYISDLKYFVRHWRYGMDETTSFLQYYKEENGNSSEENLVPLSELDKTEAIEEIYATFRQYYGVSERELCKDCSHQDKIRVVHSV